MTNKAKISIITPTLNSQKDIEACIASVANQTYPNKEHLIIDGQSIDGTSVIVKKYAAKYPHIRWISEKDKGIYDAMNKGLDMVDGDWIYFLGGDDVLLNPGALDDVFNHEITNQVDVVYGDVLWGDTGIIYDGEFDLVKLLKQNICHQAIFTRKEVFEKLGNFNVKYKSVADWEFNLRWFVNQEIKRAHISTVIAKYNIGGFSAKNNDKVFLSDKVKIIESFFPKEHIEAYKEIVLLEGIFQQKDQEISNLSQAIQQKDQAIQQKDQAVQQKDQAIQQKDQTILQKESEIQKKEQVIRQKGKEINTMKSSKFWKMRQKYMKLKGMLKL